MNGPSGRNVNEVQSTTADCSESSMSVSSAPPSTSLSNRQSNFTHNSSSMGSNSNQTRNANELQSITGDGSINSITEASASMSISLSNRQSNLTHNSNSIGANSNQRRNANELQSTTGDDSMNSMTEASAPLSASFSNSQSNEIDYSNFSELDEIARGGSGEVYSAKWKGHKRKIALKFFHGNEDGNREFRKENEFLNKLRHPNIVELLGCSSKNVMNDITGQISICKILVLELANTTLSNVYDDPKIEDENRHKWCEDVLEAVNYLHKYIGIIHRDIKFENILVFHDGKHWIELRLITIEFCFIYEKQFT